MEDAWASIGEEGRGQLRKAPGISKHEMIRRFPNGATRHAEGMTHESGPTQRTETSKYLQEKKEIIDFPSSGERKGNSPNRCCCGNTGVVGLRAVFNK